MVEPPNYDKELFAALFVLFVAYIMLSLFFTLFIETF